MEDFLFHGSLSDLDPDIYELTEIEAERQYRRLILIPSESSAPIAVREALSSVFQNIYAEGYPPISSRKMSEKDILNYSSRLSEYRRFSDPRYYKGVEYANTIEAIARKRCAELFAANGVSANQIYVNVQALSGAPANNAVYHALVDPGDTVMGMNLLHGGHLSHGSPVNRSGKYFNIVQYTVDPDTEKIDYEAMAELAEKHKPRMIIGGFSSYPWAADWEAMRKIADSVGAYLLADIAHVAGLVAAGVYPSPIGHAHVVTSTTHKTLNGPRGAIIMTTSRKISEKIDRAVFPGEQGGPHVNVFAGLALTFKIAKSNEFKSLQNQVIKNCIALTDEFQKRGLRIPFGGTNTHLTNVDTKSVVGPSGTKLSGDMAARILDLAGIVVNRNTIPGDRSAFNPSGIRLGTPWITQRGFKEKESRELANIIADILFACIPYRERSADKLSQRAKIDFDTLSENKLRVRYLAEKAGIDFKAAQHGYPHFYYPDDQPSSKNDWVALELGGKHAKSLLNIIVSQDMDQLEINKTLDTFISINKIEIIGTITYVNKNLYRLSVPAKHFSEAAEWLRALSDGYLLIDPNDPARKSPGPVTVIESAEDAIAPSSAKPDLSVKAYYLGSHDEKAPELPDFVWRPQELSELKRTPLFEEHISLGAKMVPFAGWEMPVRYSSVREEHMAVREAAGLFDVTHMGVYQASGPSAQAFLDSLCANDIAKLKIGHSLYTHFLDAQGLVLDDLLVYRIENDRFLLVVNAANDDRNWAWLNDVRKGKVLIEPKNPAGHAFGRNVNLTNLRDPKSGKEMLIDIALQGPLSRDILLSLLNSAKEIRSFKKLKRFRLGTYTLGKEKVIVSRTGYTGENFSFELFIHPEKATKLWSMLLKAGANFNIRPCGLAARDSLRIEAGLPLFGQELAGPSHFSPADSGFRSFVKSYKPWFIGRDAFLAKEKSRKKEIVRFRFPSKGTRPAHYGDPISNDSGKAIGFVTSCSLDKYGTLTGQAYISKKFKREGRQIYVYQGQAGKNISEIKIKASPAIVLSRFPK